MARPKKNDKNVEAPKQEDTNLQKAADVAKTLRSVDVAANLAKVISNAGIKQNPPQAKKDRWELELDSKTNISAEQFVGATTLLKKVEQRVETTKAAVVSYCSKEILKKVWENKGKPSNPEVLIRNSNGDIDHRFIFMCQDRLKVDHPEIPENADVKEFITNLFVRIGLSNSNAKNLVENELDFNPVTGIRSLTELLDGHYGSGREWIESNAEEKSAGVKLANLLMWDGTGTIDPLTPAEKCLVVKTNPNVMVKAEFFSRVATYCESLSQLEAVFSIIKPVYSVGHVKFAMNDSDVARIKRTVDVATDILSKE